MPDPSDRQITTIEEAVALLDEWIAYARSLEGQLARLDHAWRLEHRKAEMEMHRTFAELCDIIGSGSPGDAVLTLPPRQGTAARSASPFDT